MNTCCQFATDEELQEDPESYDCETCERRIERARLTLADETALSLHRRLSGRAVQDLHLTRLVFETARLRMSADEADLLLDRLELIHEYANLPEQADRSAEEIDE